MKLIGLVGPAKAGKSSVAAHLVEHHGFERTRFAQPIKDMLLAAGLTHEQVDGDEKNTPLPLLDGATSRWAQQSLGTEWGRRLISPNIWVNLTRYRLVSRCTDQPVVIDDVRCLSEAGMIRDLGGKLWYIQRPDVEPDLRLHKQGLRLLRLGIEALPISASLQAPVAGRLPLPLHSSETEWVHIVNNGWCAKTLRNTADLTALLRQASAYAQRYFETYADEMEAPHDGNGFAAEQRIAR